MNTPEVPLSILDLAVVGRDDSVADALHATVDLARAAEVRGYRRIWYAEHHNIASIASSATAVLIAHVAAHTERILLGAGGIMLPNHAPLVIAEQFGTLATLHPGRIELGLGRAPGTDRVTLRALRRELDAAETFPQDVIELHGYLAGQGRVPGVAAIPGAGTEVPLWILGSSLFGAELAARLGLPYGFASHFAPAQLTQAVSLYRTLFEPSAHLDRPHVMAGVNVVVAPDGDEAEAMAVDVRRRRVASFLLRGSGDDRRLDDDELDALVRSPQGHQITAMMRHTAVGTPERVRVGLEDFASYAGADELMVVLNATTIEARRRSVDLLADAYGDEDAGADIDGAPGGALGSVS